MTTFIGIESQMYKWDGDGLSLFYCPYTPLNARDALGSINIEEVL